MRDMRRSLLAICLATTFTAAACGSKAPTPDETTQRDTVVTAASTTTPQASECSETALTAAAGEPIGYVACSRDWAAVQTTAYTESCGECESMWLFQQAGATWELRAVCNQMAPLTPEVAGCSSMRGLIADGNYTDDPFEAPAAQDACVIWPANRWPENVALTGCEPDEN